MKIAIASDNGYVSAHFGRCPSFTIIEVINDRIISKEEVKNPGHEPGRIPQFLYEKNVDCIICGGMGKRAQDFFEEYDIQVITGITDNVEDTIEMFKKGILKSSASLCVPGNGRGYGIEKTECDHQED